MSIGCCRDHVGPVAAGFLGVVQGGVGRGQHVGQLAALPVEGGDADRDGDLDGPAGVGLVADRDGQPGDVGAQPLGDIERVRLAGVRQQDDELLAAEPAGQVVGPQLAAQAVGHGPERLVSDQVAVGVVDRLEVVDVDQGQGQRRGGTDGAGDLGLGFGFKGRGVEQPGLGVDPGLGQQLPVHHEAPDQQHGGYGEDGQERADRDHDGDQHAEVELGEVGHQRLAVELQVGEADGGVGQLDAAHDQRLVPAAADLLGQGDGDSPGQRVQPGADRAARERRGERAEHHRRRPVGQRDGAHGEDPPVDHAPEDPELGEHVQRDGRDHGVERRQQDRDGQDPHGDEVPGDAALAVDDPRGGRDRDQAAAQQQGELPHVVGVPGHPGRGHHGQRGRGDGHHGHVAAQQPWKLPPGPVPDRRVRQQAASEGRGTHAPPFQTGRARLLSSRKLTVKD